MAIATTTALALATVAVAAAGTAYSIASAPDTPPAPPIPKPPPAPPGAPEPPPPAPSATEAGAGPARIRRQQSRRFGLQQTLLTTPLGGAGTSGGSGVPGTMQPGGRGLLGG